MEHEDYMEYALELAGESARNGETPVGCVIADKTGAIIGTGRNRREKNKTALSHAELEAIENACRARQDWRLSGCTMYVTLEPCPMCAGAVIMSRISKLYYGAKDELTGSCGSVLNLFMEPYGHKTQITGGILSEKCAQIITDFFRTLR